MYLQKVDILFPKTSVALGLNRFWECFVEQRCLSTAPYENTNPPGIISLIQLFVYFRSPSLIQIDRFVQDLIRLIHRFATVYPLLAFGCAFRSTQLIIS